MTRIKWLILFILLAGCTYDIPVTFIMVTDTPTVTATSTFIPSPTNSPTVSPSPLPTNTPEDATPTQEIWTLTPSATPTSVYPIKGYRSFACGTPIVIVTTATPYVVLGIQENNWALVQIRDGYAFAVNFGTPCP